MIYLIIWSLEELAIAQACPYLTPKDIERMETHNLSLEAALRRGDPVGASRVDTSFHGVFITRTENPFLMNILNDLKVRCRRSEVAYFGGSVLAQVSVR